MVFRNVIIPYKLLTSDALHDLVSNFVLREGTDYGLREISTQDKVNQIMRLLETKQAFIVFDEKTDTTSILSKNDPSVEEYLKENLHV